jgi:hypothetical protein
MFVELGLRLRAPGEGRFHSRSVVLLKTERSSVSAKTLFDSVPAGPAEIFRTCTGAICCASEGARRKATNRAAITVIGIRGRTSHGRMT